MIRGSLPDGPFINALLNGVPIFALMLTGAACGGTHLASEALHAPEHRLAARTRVEFGLASIALPAHWSFVRHDAQTIVAISNEHDLRIVAHQSSDCLDVQICAQALAQRWMPSVHSSGLTIEETAGVLGYEALWWIRFRPHDPSQRVEAVLHRKAGSLFWLLYEGSVRAVEEEPLELGHLLASLEIPGTGDDYWGDLEVQRLGEGQWVSLHHALNRSREESALDTVVVGILRGDDELRLESSVGSIALPLSSPLMDEREQNFDLLRQRLHGLGLPGDAVADGTHGLRQWTWTSQDAMRLLWWLPERRLAWFIACEPGSPAGLERVHRTLLRSVLGVR